ncbi:MAG TPA: M61 family peptidase, partial [Thermoanaerobaculia bacterium]
NGQAATAIRLEVDARDAPRRILHAKMTIPAAAGKMRLQYPKWLPGEHGPTGPIADVAGLKVSAAGRPIPWRRDSAEMYAFEIEVPAGASSVEVSLDFLDTLGGQFTAGASATANLAFVSWNQLLLYPAGVLPDQLRYAASIELPEGWQYATALRTASRAGSRIVFEPVSLTQLVDSPLLAGRYFRVVDLGGKPEHRLNIAADGASSLAIKPAQEQAFRNLVAETGALFQGRPYEHYDFLLILSDLTAHFGLEHHQSSDNRVKERGLLSDNLFRMSTGPLLSHEVVHTWNGKYRRPEIQAIGRFDTPMRGDLLWVYEGLTTYLGQILAPRSSLITPQDYREMLAVTLAEQEATRGREWRPLIDTAISAQILFGAHSDRALWRRSVDFYSESELLWLEADMQIRNASGGKKSLDDFCKAFHGGYSGPPKVVPYNLEQLMAALKAVVPMDWSKWWRDRIEAVVPHAPVAGIEASGWKLVWRDEPTAVIKAAEGEEDVVNARYSVGFLVRPDGWVGDVVPGSPADKAGLSSGVKIVAVNGRRYERDFFRDALIATKGEKGTPMELIVENGKFFSTHKLDYEGGQRYPDLERDESKPDTLSRIIAPKAAPAPK